MTNQHRATPEQWKDVEEFLSTLPYPSTASCLLELRDRLAAAEQRISELEQRPIPGSVELAADHSVDASKMVAPTTGLVKRVQQIIGHAFPDDARSAILVVAEWLDQRALDYSAGFLREEVQRHG